MFTEHSTGISKPHVAILAFQRSFSVGVMKHVMPGIERDAAYFVRPDGYVSIASPEQNVGPQTGYRSLWAEVWCS
jgi:hypothetical protein